MEYHLDKKKCFDLLGMDRSIISWLYLNSWIHQINHAKRVHRINASGSKTPREIRAAGRAAHRNSEKLALLLDEWTSCQGQWKESNLYLRMSESTRHRKCGARCWLTRAELVQKYGDVEAATHIWESKLADAWWWVGYTNPPTSGLP